MKILANAYRNNNIQKNLPFGRTKAIRLNSQSTHNGFNLQGTEKPVPNPTQRGKKSRLAGGDQEVYT
jgi:hypothetical protein